MNKAFQANRVSVIYRNESNGCSLYGKGQFFEALNHLGAEIQQINHWTQTDEEMFLMIGTTNDRRIQLLLKSKGVEVCQKPEGVYYQWCNAGTGTAFVIAGTDEKGLMYALLELTDRVRAYGMKALTDVEDTIEFPDNLIRGVDRYVLGHLDEEWLFSEDFWHYFLARLAGARFNRFSLILGFDTAYMTPPYPFFVKVPGYPQVRAVGLDDKSLERNLKQLRRIGQLCKEYGQQFILATWQQTPWTTTQKKLVEGLSEEENDLSLYCVAGLKELLNQCEEIDGVQFRVNHESGVGTQTTAEEFWKRCIDAVAEVAATGRPLILDLRAKGLTDHMIEHALEKGLHIEVPTKFWCEHAGLPYHLSVMRSEELGRLQNLNASRRYSYADLLKKPHHFDVLFRLWNYGSTDLFLWGDPDYARRFSQSCMIGGSIGFQINSPLSLKGGHEMVQNEPWAVFADPELRYGRWEDERYWFWYIVFGRLGYSLATDSAVWQREFCSHFGVEAAGILETGLRFASKILPLITAAHMPIHPSLNYWTELSTGAALFAENNYNKRFNDVTYSTTEPSDNGLFYGISDYVGDFLGGKLDGKYSPLQVSTWLQIFADEVRKALCQTDEMKSLSENPEFRAMKLDMQMLIDLAEYHVWKIKAATAFCFYNATGNVSELISAYKSMRCAGASWKSMAKRGEGAYHHNLEFGSGGGAWRRGNWNDLIPEIEADITQLKGILEKVVPEFNEDDLLVDKENPVGSLRTSLPFSMYALTVDWPDVCQTGKDLIINVSSSEFSCFPNGLKLHYRHTNQLEGKFNILNMIKTDKGYAGIIPGEYIVPEWDLLVYLTTVSDEGECFIFPGVYHPQYHAPYHIIETV